MLVAATLLPRDLSGWVLAIAATAVLVTAALSRVGARAAVAVVLGWAAVLQLGRPDLEARPWIAVLVALVLIGVAEVLSALSADVPWWARWDDWLLVSTVPVAGTALAVSAGTPSAAAVFAAVGAECLLAASWLRRHPAAALGIGTTGTLLVLVGAGTAGPGWLALATLGLSAGLTALATRTRGLLRTALQLSGAVAAVCSWRMASSAWDLPDQRAVDVAAMAAALVVVAAVAVALATRLERSWLLVWGGTAAAVEALCAFDAVAPHGIWREMTHPSWPVTAGLAVVAAALLVAPSQRLRVAWLPDLAVGYGLAALLLAMLTADVGLRGQVAVLCVASVVSAAATPALARRPGPVVAATGRRGRRGDDGCGRVGRGPVRLDRRHAARAGARRGRRAGRGRGRRLRTAPSCRWPPPCSPAPRGSCSAPRRSTATPSG